MAALLTYIGVILFIGYACYRLFWGIVWLIQSIEKNEIKAEQANHRLTGKLATSLIFGAAIIAVIAKWLFYK